MQTKAQSGQASLVSEALLYWDKYLWHHRNPWTRRLHRMGSWSCIAGVVAAVAGFGWFWVPLSMVVGYGFAFCGHWFVEKNRPLTFENPLRAGIANWVMFVFEMVGDVDGALERLALNPPMIDDMGTQ